MDLLARRIDTEGPIPARDAVRLTSRLLRTVEGLHAAGAVHGRLSAEAIALAGPRIAQARLLPASACKDDDAFHSPERRAGAGASRGDDGYAIALLLYFLLTGWTQPRSAEAAAPQNQRPPPLAVFDAGDDALEQILLGALSVEPAARPRSLAAFRAELDSWLDGEGATVDDALPFADAPSDDAPVVDVASLPPPPSPGEPAPAQPNKGDLFAVLDEDSTWKNSEASERKRSVRPPRLVPPRAALSKPPPQRPTAREIPPLPDEEQERPTLPRAEPAKPADEADAPPSSTPADDAEKPAAPKPAAAKRAAPKAEPGKARWSLVVGGTAAAVVLAYVIGRDRTQPPPTRADGGPAAASSTPSKPGPEAPRPASSLVEPTGKPAASATEPVASSASVAPSASASSSASAAPSTSAASSASAPPASAPPAPADVAACMRKLFPADTFQEGAASLTFVCEEPSPVRGAPRVREALVRDSDGKVTEGMKEWAILGFFELGAYAVLRGRCCPADVAPLELPISPGKCPPLAESLGEVAAASQPGADDKALKRAIDHLDRDVRCILRSKQTKPFGSYPRLSGGEGTALSKTMKRGRVD